MNVRIYKFYEFQLHTATRELYRMADEATVLPARIFDCMLHLIEQRERAVGRDELVAVIWDRADIGDNVLAQLLARTRKLLGDTGDEQRFIRTVPGFGYHWIAPTSVLDDVRLPPSATDQPRLPSAEQSDNALEHASRDRTGTQDQEPAEQLSKPKRGRRGFAGWLGIAVIGVLSTIAFWASREQRVQSLDPLPIVPLDAASMPPLANRPALVLPAIVDPSAAQDWQRLGIMAFVIERLGASGCPTVRSDNVVGLTRGVDIAALERESYATLAEAAGASWVIRIRIDALDSGRRWRVGLAVVHGLPELPVSVNAEGEQILDAAREAADRLLVATGASRSIQAPSVDGGLSLILRQSAAKQFEGRLEEAWQILADAEGRYPDSTDLRYEIAWLEYLMGRFDSARGRLLALVDNLAKNDEPLALARTFNALSNVYYQARDFDKTEQYSQQAIDLLQDRPEGINELGRAWRGRARASGARGNYEQALGDAGRARVLLASGGDWLGVARTDTSMGIALRRSGRLRDSLPVLERAADRLQQFQDLWDEALTRVHLITALLALNEAETALAQTPRLRELDALLLNPDARAGLWLERAHVLISNGRLAEARPLIEAAHRQFSTAEGGLHVYGAFAMETRLALAAGNRQQAEASALEALKRLRDPEEDPREVGWTAVLLARLQTPRDPALGLLARKALANWLRPGETGHGDFYSLLIDAAIADAGKRFNDASAIYETALAQRDAAPIDVLRLAIVYVPTLLEHGEQDRAAEIVGQLGDVTGRNFDAALLEARLHHATRNFAARQGALDRARALAGERPMPYELEESNLKKD